MIRTWTRERGIHRMQKRQERRLLRTIKSLKIRGLTSRIIITRIIFGTIRILLAGRWLNSSTKKTKLTSNVTQLIEKVFNFKTLRKISSAVSQCSSQKAMRVGESIREKSNAKHFNSRVIRQPNQTLSMKSALSASKILTHSTCSVWKVWIRPRTPQSQRLAITKDLGWGLMSSLRVMLRMWFLIRWGRRIRRLVRIFWLNCRKSS